MKNLIFFLTAILLAQLQLAEAYFYVPSFMNTLPFKGGMQYAQSGNSLYIFGGENATELYTNDFYKLTQTNTSYSWEIVPQMNPLNGTLYGQAYITADNQNMILLGGMSNETFGRGLPLQIHSYNFASQRWTPFAGNNANVSSPPPPDFIYNRQFFSATYDKKNQRTYIYGGAIQSPNGPLFLNDLHVLDANFKSTVLQPTPLGRYGHSASILSNGQIVVVGGIIVGAEEPTLAGMDQVWLYDPPSNNWVVRNVTDYNGHFPSATSDFVSVVTDDDKIIIFGGNDRSSQQTREYLNTIAILDTKTWAWTIPTIQGIPPSRRAYAIGGLLDNKHLTIAFGASSNLYYNDINTFDLSTNSWLQTFDESNSSGNSLSKGLIAGVTVAAVVLLVIILFLLWKFQSYIRWLIVRIHNDIWKPRTGEPIWAETSRIISQIFFLFIFVMFLYFVIRQAVDSPNVTQRIEHPSPDVEVPDVRFCFDGFPSQSQMYGPPGVSCQTDIGYSCNSFIKPLNMSIFKPTFSDNLGPVNCYLFRAPEGFKMTLTAGNNNGSRLLFTMWGDQTIDYGVVHISVYPKRMDPNAKIYGYDDGISNYLSEVDIANWQTTERNDLQATNVYTVRPYTYSALSYDIVDHRYLQPVGWNYVGFLPVTNSTPEIVSNFRSEAPNPNYSKVHADLGFIAIFPENYAQIIDREIKMYTLVNALGFVGGIFGLLVAAQTWLFGYRPRSPWGVVHRWATGSRKQSLLQGLQNKFKTTDSGIPLVHPVHHRFSVNEFQNLGQETEAQRVSRVEERMQVLELLFKAYYVDDEVFRSLDYASSMNNNKELPSYGQQFGMASAGNNPLFPSTEKLSPYQTPKKEDQNGFSHMFSERPSHSSISSDTNSQLHLNSSQDVHLRDMR